MFLEGIPCVQVTLPKVDIEPGNLGPSLMFLPLDMVLSEFHANLQCSHVCKTKAVLLERNINTH